MDYWIRPTAPSATNQSWGLFGLDFRAVTCLTYHIKSVDYIQLADDYSSVRFSSAVVKKLAVPIIAPIFLVHKAKQVLVEWYMQVPTIDDYSFFPSVGRRRVGGDI